MKMKSFFISKDLYMVEYQFKDFKHEIVFSRSVSIMVGFRDAFLEIPSMVLTRYGFYDN